MEIFAGCPRRFFKGLIAIRNDSWMNSFLRFLAVLEVKWPILVKYGVKKMVSHGAGESDFGDGRGFEKVPGFPAWHRRHGGLLRKGSRRWRRILKSAIIYYLKDLFRKMNCLIIIAQRICSSCQPWTSREKFHSRSRDTGNAGLKEVKAIYFICSA